MLDNEEVGAVLACLAVIFGWYGDERGAIQGRSLTQLAQYVDAWKQAGDADCWLDLAQAFAGAPGPGRAPLVPHDRRGVLR